VKPECEAKIRELGLLESEVFARIERESLWPLASVSPNDWNPKETTDARLLSIAGSLKQHGWLESDLPLLWREKPKGEALTILNGEHRWLVCKAAGFERYPGVLVSSVKTREDAMAITMAMEAAKARHDAKQFTANLVAMARAGRDEELRRVLGIRDPAALRQKAQENSDRIRTIRKAQQSEGPPRVVSMTMTGPQYMRWMGATEKARSNLKRAGIAVGLVDKLGDGDLLDLAGVFQQWQKTK
jgi:hypothetical protein